MQTPYLIVKSSDKIRCDDLHIEHRVTRTIKVDDFSLFFFPPDIESEEKKFDDRVWTDGEKLFYEDGFMLRYPDPYIRRVFDKKELFDVPSIELDGFFSRIKIENNVFKIDGSAMYLQMLFSFEHENFIAFSNNFSLLVDFITKSGIELEINDDFFANHMLNYSLAYYISAGTPFKNIEFHDSLQEIKIDHTVSSTLSNKFASTEIAEMNRDDRLDLLHKKLSHMINEYSDYIDVDVLGHNLTAGRDSRASFSLFLEKQRERLEIVTTGFNYTPDRVISNYVAKKYGVKIKESIESTAPPIFNYRKVMDRVSEEEVFIPMFRNIQVTTRFNENMFVASGYLGNVVTFSGSEKNQVLRDNRYKIDPETHDRLMLNYDKKITELESVYGDKSHSMFNIMYNTTNKVASFCRRLKFNTLCIFETDFLQLCYLLETDEQKKSASIHYELMKRSNNDLLTKIPFEANKSFDHMDDTFEIQSVKESGFPRLYKIFLEKHLEKIHAYLEKNKEHLPFVSHEFLDIIKEYFEKDIPPLLINKIYAAVGTLEFKGIKFTGYDSEIKGEERKLYTMEFFENLYLESQIYVSGLPAMVYHRDVVFKTFVEIGGDDELRINIINSSIGEKIPVTLDPADDGTYVRLSIESSGKYNVNFSSINKATNTITQLYKHNFIAKIDNAPVIASNSRPISTGAAI